MQALNQSPTLRGLAAVGGLLAGLAAAVVGIILAVLFAATVVAIVLVAAIVVSFAVLAIKARRWLRKAPRSAEAGLIEARHTGGHSWVAYGWDNHR